ncbi:hypothetical protein V8C40DRAFT_253314 [Trichoderma camerunense]
MAMAYKGISEENTAMDEEQQVPFLPPIDHPGRTSEHTKQNIRPDYLKIAMYGLLGLSAMLIIGGLRSKPTFEGCVKHLHEWSPILEAFEREARPRIGMTSNFIYMGHPTSVLEQAWDSLWQFGSFGFPEEQLPLLHKSSTEHDWHHLPEADGGGIQAYVEGFHYIHCLNLVRQFTYRNEYDYSDIHAFNNPHMDIMDHVEHCLEMLRVKIMCDADLSIYPVSRDTSDDRTIHIEGQNKVCPNFERLVKWADDHIAVPFHKKTEG